LDTSEKNFCRSVGRNDIDFSSFMRGVYFVFADKLLFNRAASTDFALICER
jgi:hypothetical protein